MDIRKKISVFVLFGLLSGWPGGGLFLAAETLQITQQIVAFDPSDPKRQIGYFQAKSALEIEEFVPSAKMYRVKFKTPDGTEIRALCRPEDLGKTVPLPEKMETPRQEEKNTGAPGFDQKPSPQPTVFGFRSSSPPPIFASIIQLDPALWDTTTSGFALKQSSHGFRWVSLTDTNVSRSNEKLTFLDHPVFETISRFKEGKLEEVMLLLFGRGDAGTDLGEKEFQELMKKVEASMDEWLKTRGMDAWVPDNVADTKRKSWFKVPLRVDLEWSVTRNVSEKMEGIDIKKRFRTEFVRLVVSPYDGKQDAAQLVKPNFQSSAKPITLKRAELKERVKHEANGDIYLESVPMVDQGQKGYCVVASAERVMRFYGLNLDQNELAKAANTATEGGTSPEDMFKALKKIGGQFSLSVRELKGFDIRDFLKEVEDYNRLAKKEKRQTIELPQFGLINIGHAYMRMDPEALRQVRLKKVNDRTRFIKDIADLIDKGAPALWSVTLGFVPETPLLPQAQGGHMRLIIGYNKKESEIIYTDSWGVGHEFKRMKMDDAWFITDALYSVLPGA